MGHLKVNQNTHYGNSRRTREQKAYKEIIIENLPNLGRELNMQIHNTQRITGSISRGFDIIIKLPNIEFLKQELTLHIQGTPSKPHKSISGFLRRNFAAERKWHDIKSANQEYYTQQSCLSEIEERVKTF